MHSTHANFIASFFCNVQSRYFLAEILDCTLQFKMPSCPHSSEMESRDEARVYELASERSVKGRSKACTCLAETAGCSRSRPTN